MKKPRIRYAGIDDGAQWNVYEKRGDSLSIHWARTFVEACKYAANIVRGVRCCHLS